MNARHSKSARHTFVSFAFYRLEPAARTEGLAGKMQITAFFFVAKKLLRVRSCTQQNKFVWFVFPSEKIGATGREQSEELNAIKCLVL